MMYDTLPGVARAAMIQKVENGYVVTAQVPRENPGPLQPEWEQITHAFASGAHAVAWLYLYSEGLDVQLAHRNQWMSFRRIDEVAKALPVDVFNEIPTAVNTESVDTAHSQGPQ
jgi:hypothetical protein